MLPKWISVDRVDVKVFLEKSSRMPVVDVRTPGEFAAGHIPGAVNIPLFSNDERATIGTIYKQQGRQAAVKQGLGIVGPKMKALVEEVDALGASAVGLYCWRGGMRSGSMAWLLEQYAIHPCVLENGYKAYRKFLLRFFSQPLPLKVITGFTGSQKTALLHKLAELGEQVVDLEALAQHQGSSFGNQKAQRQPTTEHFQNLVFEKFRILDLTRPVWIEDECMRIGNVSLVEDLYRQKNASPHIFIEIEKAERIDFLVRDYGSLSKDQLIQATQNIARKLGSQNANEAIRDIECGDLKSAADILLQYYDKRYEQSISRKKHMIEAHFNIKMSELDRMATTLAEIAKHAV